MTHRVGMYPTYSNSEWERNANPQLKYLAESIENNGWEVVPLTIEEVVEPEKIVEKNIQIVHLHWSVNILRHLILDCPDNDSKVKILRKSYLKFLRMLFRSNPPKNVFLKFIYKLFSSLLEKEYNRKIDNWIDSLKKSKLKVVWQIHDLVTHAFEKGSIAARADAHIHKRLYDLSDAIVVHESSCLNPVFELYGPKKDFAIAYLGDYSSALGKPIEKKDARKKLNISPKGKVISYLGSVRPNRNPSEFIAGFKNVANSGDLLILAGNQSNVKNYIKINDSRLKVFDGFLDANTMRDIYCASDFVVNDAINYLTSAVIRTSISYSVPVIVYPYGSAIDTAKDTAIFIGEEENALENAITKAVEINKKKYGKMVLSAKKRNLERNWEQNGVEIVKLYNRLIKSVKK